MSSLPNVINLAHISGALKTPTDLVNRDSIINSIEKILEQNDVVFIEGESGIGKSTLLLDFVWQNSLNAISHFVEVNYTYTFSYDCLIENLYRQIHFYCKNEEFDQEQSVDTALFNSISSLLFKKIKSSKKPLYFVFDGFNDINKDQLENLISIFDSLPFGRAKFIFSGAKDQLNSILSSKKLRSKDIPISNFGLNETKLYLKDICNEESKFQELHKLSDKGFPQKLKEIKLLCLENGGVDNFLNSPEISEKTDFLKLLWSKVKSEDVDQSKLLSLVAFTDTQLSLSSISSILKIDEKILKEKIDDLSFIEISNDVVQFKTETFRKFARNKLKDSEDKINYLLIDYYEVNSTSEESVFNLPYLYQKAKRWEKLTKFYSIDAFIHIMEKHRTMGNVNSHFSQGFDASKKNSSGKFNEAILRFALHKSSAKELEKNELWESEIEARIALDDYDQALALANSAFLKEDRLKLLATLAKQRRLKDLDEDKNLIDQIRILYQQLDLSKIQERAFEIAGLLVYSCFDLAIDLVEKISNNTASNNSLDYAFAYLALSASDANTRNNKKIVDIDVINSKIQNSDVKNITNALKFLSGDYSAQQIIEHVKGLPKFSHKLFLLKSWISNNPENENVGHAIQYTLEEIVKTSIESVPNATSLSEIAKPLPKIKNHGEIEKLILLFDAQKNTIDRPTKDFVTLQLTIAEALNIFDSAKSKDRIFDVYYLITDLNDLSIKTDCLALLWTWLIRNDNDHDIENNISAIESIEVQVRNNINSLLKDTAYHFKMVEFIVKQISSQNINFVIETISKLNTQTRKDGAYKLAVITYLKNSKVENIDLNVVNKLYKAIESDLDKEEVIIEVIERYYNEKEKVIVFIPSLLNYYDLIKRITHIENKCYVITHAIKIMNFDKGKYLITIEALLEELRISLESIDLRASKIQIAFTIARDLADYSKEEAQKYLALGTELKQNEPFSSNSLVNTYINSTKLCIRAFCGLIPNRENLEIELRQLNGVFNQIQSSSKKLELWSEVALRAFSYGKKDLFDAIYKQYIHPLLGGWSNLKNVNQIASIIQIAPALYLYNQNVFFNDYWLNLPGGAKDPSIKNICDFILTKLLPDDPIADHQKKIKIEYSELSDICSLIEKLKDDLLIYLFINQVVNSIKENKNLLSSEHRNFIKQKLRSIINTKFPASQGIQHDGYKIISDAELLSLEHYKQDDWDKLIKRARQIPNLSDRALILVTLTGTITEGKKNKKLELIDEAFTLIKSIPSIFDKTNRFDSAWETILDIDKGQFNKYLNQAFQDLLKSKDGEIVGLRNLIDVAHQHDPKLAENCVTLLDQDEARKKLKAPLLKRIENNSKINAACNEYSKLSSLDSLQFEQVFHKNLEEFNSGRMVSKDIMDTLYVIEKASSFSLTEAFEAYLYFIQNANKQLEKKSKGSDTLNSIFLATIENTKLIAILSSDNVNKMKSLYSTTDRRSSEGENPIIAPGERELALDHIKTWLENNIDEKMFFIDPYFSEKELEILLYVQEIKPTCKVTVLTSKKNNINSHCDSENLNRSTNKEVYIRSWQKISSQPPLNATIKIVWDKDTFECPFHDRWYVAGEAKSALCIGTSFNGLGNRASQILELDGDALLNVQELIGLHIYREENKVNKYNLKYERFDLD